jgi:aerobic-type carbon monoxide dehydrogenase small subunit (CoxS/CutS family)
MLVFNVNGRNLTLNESRDMSLLWALRDVLGNLNAEHLSAATHVVTSDRIAVKSGGGVDYVA